MTQIMSYRQEPSCSCVFPDRSETSALYKNFSCPTFSYLEVESLEVFSLCGES